MKKTLFILMLSIVSVFLCSCQRAEPWEPLFNDEDLSNWETFVGTSLQGFDSLAAMAAPEKVFSVVQTEEGAQIRISGEVNGSLATRGSYGNYQLRLVYRWGGQVYTSRNSGLLYHSTGSFGAAFGTWMTNIECQLMHGNLGDTYLMNHTVCETEAVKNDSSGFFVFTPGAPPLPFGETTNGRSVKKLTDAENPVGEWNTVELYTFGQTAVHVVNGITVMVNTHTGLSDGDSITPLTSGKIQIQSEGGELFIRSIDIRPIRRLPDGIVP